MPRYEVTITETVVYSMVVDAESGDDAEEIATEHLLNSDDINQWFDSVDERETEHEEVAADYEHLRGGILTRDNVPGSGPAPDQDASTGPTHAELEEFSMYLRNLSDDQVRAVHEKETTANRASFAALAKAEAQLRGITL